MFFAENLKIDEGADVDGYIKRLPQNSSSTTTKQSQNKSREKKEKQLEIEDSEKKAVNQS